LRSRVPSHEVEDGVVGRFPDEPDETFAEPVAHPEAVHNVRRGVTPTDGVMSDASGGATDSPTPDRWCAVYAPGEIDSAPRCAAVNNSRPTSTFPGDG
jgi:hypothetical protein